MPTQKKAFDAVRLMREIRDQLSREFAGLSFEEQQQRMRARIGRRVAPSTTVTPRPRKSA